MDMVLVDWTRMGTSYCLAGAVAAPGGGWRMVRPLLARHKNDVARNVGWSGYLMDRHCRWEVFELVGAEAAPAAPPHLEDLWVVGMRPRRRQATPAQRRAVLEAGARPAGQPVFDERLKRTRTAAYLEAGHGDRSLGTFLVGPRLLSFSAALRPPNKTDYRVHIDLPGLADLTLPVKDHFLLTRAETAGGDLPTRVQALERAVGQMGETVAVRLGLSRPFAAEDATAAHCWLMADGFFSLADPQP